jgi:transcription elongation factor Elf1
MGIKEFKQTTEQKKAKCIFCDGKVNVSVLEHEYIKAGTMLKFIYHCHNCQITFSVEAY